MMNGIMKESPSMKLYDFERLVGSSNIEFPAKFTLSRMAEIKNQGNGNWCGGCAMATIAEYVWGKEFSEGWNYAKFRTHEGTGLYAQKALDMWRAIGTVPFADFGAVGEMPDIRELVDEHPELLEIAAKYKLESYAGINYASREKRDKAIKQAISSGIPVLAAITLNGGGHAVALDGWDDEKGVYTYQNSYGKKWGDGGYGTVSKNKIDDVYALVFSKVEFPFTDVSPEMWSYSAIKNMYLNGLMKGVSDTEFEPSRAVTREELAAVLDRLCEMFDSRIERVYDIMNERDVKE